MEKRKKMYVSFTVLFGVIGIGLLVVSLTTNHWVFVNAHLSLNISANFSRLASGTTKFKGEIYFGLFNGRRWTDSGGGKREINITVTTDIHKYKLMNHGLWLTTVVFLICSICFGLISIGFTFYNLLGKPIETITGPIGLYVWNFGACIFSILTFLVFIALFYTSTNKNDIFEDDYLKTGWRSADRARLDWSFWITIGSVVAFLINIILLVISGQQIRMPNYSASAEKTLDGVMMY